MVCSVTDSDKDRKVDEKTGPTVASITAGLLTRSEAASQFRCSERTIIRREHEGMPVIRLGSLRLYNPEAVRAWLMGYERRREPVRRGRPVGRAA